MLTALRLMAVLAHPDDESLGLGGALVKYASEGVEVSVVMATLGEAGRYRGLKQTDPQHPGPDALGKLREVELRAAAEVLGVRDLSLLGYRDQQLDRAEPAEVIGRIAAQIRRVKPQVVVTFDPVGAYGHPDHVAICQFTTAAVVAAADAQFVAPGPALAAHAVSKLYYMAFPEATTRAYEAVFRKMISHVDGVDREAFPWPDWSLSCVIETSAHWQTVWRAVSCHQSQITAYEKLQHLSPEHHEALWGMVSFYRAYSTVNGGRARETDLFEGLRNSAPAARAAT